ncbi:MAG: hypothetical protein KC478_15640, partial [Bacteriovoracaceae bacterium]|nr:hypothetical protein [Bacteriovoracaceae bacterium]
SAFGGELTYEQFKSSCLDPDKFGHQRPPEAIKVICEDERTRWVPVESAPFELDTVAQLSAELFSDKHHVAEKTFPLPGGETNGVCPRLREDLTSAAVELSLTCAEVLNDKRDLEDICLEAIASAEAANPDIRESMPTGNLFEPCGETAPQQQQQQQQQDEQQQDDYPRY